MSLALALVENCLQIVGRDADVDPLEKLAQGVQDQVMAVVGHQVERARDEGVDVECHVAPLDHGDGSEQDVDLGYFAERGFATAGVAIQFGQGVDIGDGQRQLRCLAGAVLNMQSTVDAVDGGGRAV